MSLAAARNDEQYTQSRADRLRERKAKRQAEGSWPSHAEFKTAARCQSEALRERSREMQSR